MTDDQKQPPGPQDPSGIEQPHDVLAAEEFAMPVEEPGRIPRDPIREPHDVLAAEEFAMPTPGAGAASSEPGSNIPWPAIAAAAVVALVLLRHLRR